MTSPKCVEASNFPHNIDLTSTMNISTMSLSKDFCSLVVGELNVAYKRRQSLVGFLFCFHTLMIPIFRAIVNPSTASLVTHYRFRFYYPIIVLFNTSNISNLFMLDLLNNIANKYNISNLFMLDMLNNFSNISNMILLYMLFNIYIILTIEQ